MPRQVPSHRGHILVVDDNRTNQILAVRLLDWLGYSADVAANGREAVKAAGQYDYGAILMDCDMPEMDGYEATAEIRRREGTVRHIPIIAMTAAVLAEERARCLAAGMDDFIAKPVNLDNVRDTLARWLAPREEPAVVSGSPAPPPQATPDAGGPAEPDGQWAETRSPLLRQLLGAFLASTRHDLARLRTAVEEADLGAMHRVAHHIKGGALIFGLEEMVASCQAVELLARSGSLDGARELVDRLERDFGAGRATLQGAAVSTLPGQGSDAPA
jgi:CheY-like chemotaxis protein/HPt (histidine-containing phosphotransfer) domain-containing protein